MSYPSIIKEAALEKLFHTGFCKKKKKTRTNSSLKGCR